MKFDPKQYKFGPILYYVQQTLGSGKAKKMKPISWDMSPEHLHEFLVFALEENGYIKKKEKKHRVKAGVDII